jgi:putative membrane protein
MEIIAKILVGIVALEHLFIFYMESFAWETLGKKTFRGAMPDDMFAKTKVLAKNQGVYNGFLAAGLIWSLVVSDPEWSGYLAIFFLCCVILAGITGAATASKKIFYTQSLPAIAALIFVLLG